MLLEKFKIFEGLEVKHGLSLRAGGVSDGPFESLNLGLDVGDSWENVCENYRRFCEAAGVSVDAICVANQEHTDKVLVVREPVGLKSVGLDKAFSGVDGFITNATGVPLVVRFADCQGVLLYDPVARVGGAVHCGWRGNAKNILAVAVGRMVSEFGCLSENILVGASASLGPCCAEFTDPFMELPKEMHWYIRDEDEAGRVRFLVDLWSCSFDQLIKAGVKASNIEMMRKCTVCENDRYFSFRGGKRKTGHMAAVIEMV